MVQDASFPSRLKSLFSTGVVIRRSGGKTLKLSDFDSISAFGNLQNNLSNGRFNRLYSGTSINQIGGSGGYGTQVSRQQLYVDYEAMDTDAICSKALDILSEEATQKSEIGEVLSIRSSNENIQEELYNLFYNVLDVETNLPIWIRNMTKYGDTFLSLSLEYGMGVYNVTPLPVYSVVREEGLDPNNQNYIRFIVDPAAVIGGSSVPNNTRDKQTYENYEMAHFRLLSDVNFMPYGKSWLEPGRKVFKQYILLKDAAILHRVMRAPEKRVFYYNVGGIPPNEVDAFMQKQISQSKKTPLIDPNTGQYNLKFNMMNMLDDFHLPVRNNDSTTRIDTAKGLDYAGMDDIYFFQNELLAALGVPKAFLNYSDELNGKSTLSGLSITFSKSVEKLQRIVVRTLQKIAQVHLYALDYEESDLNNFKLGLTIPSTLAEQEKIAMLKEKFSLMADNLDKKLVSSDWMYDNILQMSEDQIIQQRELIAEDAKREFRFKQIAEEGNDPAISGISYGTPHDLASIYKSNASGGDQNLPDGYDEKKKVNAVGRPITHASIYGTDKSAHGRDPLGKVDMYKSDKEKSFKERPMAMESGLLEGLNKFRSKRINIFDKKPEEISILSESNLLSL